MVVSQPISASTGAAMGSATNDTTPATTAQAISTPVAGSLPPSPAATVPTASSIAKPTGSAKGAASPRGFRLPVIFVRTVISVPVERQNRPFFVILINP